MHAFRILDLIQLFMDRGSFDKAIRYEGRERDLLMDVRRGRFTLEDVQNRLVRKLECVEENYKERYCQAETDPDMCRTIKEEIDSFIGQR